MISQEMIKLGTQRSVIRELFAYGLQRAEVVGAENVLDFSLGNPSVPAPKEVQEAIIDIVKNNDPMVYHGYSTSQGHAGCRKAIAANLNKRSDTAYSLNDLFITCGAAASLCITFRALTASAEDEIIVLAPYFPEYKVFIEGQGAKMKLVPARNDMKLNLGGIKEAVNKNTKALLINSPNNPSGVVYSKEEIKELADYLKKMQQELGQTIYLISDEPYRELVYNDEPVPFIPNYYDNTIICYSWSKSLSLPGERIGYVLVNDKCDDNQTVMAAVGGAARSLGYVCAPTLFQLVIEKCIDVKPNLEVYKKNRDILYDALTEMGYNVAKPDGAFYLFIEAPNGDSKQFSEKAKEHDVLVVPGTGFGTGTHIRLSYCVDTEKCEKALPVFEKLIKELK
ncbi:MAG TPA: pyridoxal phosphate-dependent aminotransferase [Clostridiales bacterium]|nr:pyridoxal phosphate-dependent aminotransferase [Clostridiales bacterium]HCS10714.1 pyridoxal phosphate-dependent aminotransferase [Clostridiales bacterium]